MNNCTEDDFVTPQTASEELVATAQMIAGIPENTEFREIYRKFLKNMVRHERTLERTKDFKCVYYQDSRLTSLDSGQKFSKKSNVKTKSNIQKLASKGFGTL